MTPVCHYGTAPGCAYRYFPAPCTTRDNWLAYERGKADLIRRYPTLTPAQYEAAIRRLCARLGV